MLKSMKAKLKSQSGFSLVELIVVIAIMVILIAMLLPSVTGLIGKASSASSASACSSIYTAATTALTNCLAEGDVGSAIWNDLSSGSGDLSVAGNLGAKLPKGATADVYADKTNKKITAVVYSVGGEYWVNPTNAGGCTNAQGYCGTTAPTGLNSTDKVVSLSDTTVVGGGGD